MKSAPDILIIFLSLLYSSNAQDSIYPLSDPSNKGGWVLNNEVSDEFDGDNLDTDKWFVQGTDGQYYNWKGRAPSQFAAHNVFIEDGKLKLRSQWEPDYDFHDQPFSGTRYENITTAGVISHKKFLYGYMEIKSKAGDASMTSSFWALGYESELDVFEQMGRPAHPEKQDFAKTYMFSIHDWRPGHPDKNKVFTHSHKLDYRVADDFHVYGCEWREDSLKFYEDGNLVYETTKEKLGDAWLLTNPLEIWFDSETFPWMGLPKEKDLPVDFEIEYVRVWQQPDGNLLDRAHFGFEGPIVVDDIRLPEKESSFRKEWYISKESKPHFKITGEKSSAGRKSMKFAHKGALVNKSVAAMSLFKSVKLPVGEYVYSMRLWIEPGSSVRKIHPVLDDPWQQLAPVDLTGLKQGEWVTVQQRFSRNAVSGEKDRLRLVVNREDAPDGESTVYIDEIRVESRR